MSSRYILSGFLVLLLQWGVLCQGPPKVTGSYKATGEMVQTEVDVSGIVVQIAFEESYDQENERTAFNIWLFGKYVRFVENYKTNQTFRYDEDVEISCKLFSLKEWIQTESPPTLLAYEDTNGTIRFSLKQLFSLDDKYLSKTERNVSAVFRGIPARKWLYEIKGRKPGEEGGKQLIQIYAFWSDTTWTTTSNKGSVPLGYVVRKTDYDGDKLGDTIHEQFVNVYGFVPGTIDHKLFEPVEGVFCPGRAQTLKFPNVANFQTLSLHSEMLLPDYQEAKYVDTYFNPLSKMLRIDLERIDNEDPTDHVSRKYESEMVIGPMQVVFRVTYFKGEATCKVIPITNYRFDMQNLINLKLPLQYWKMERAFGLNDTTYVYTGKTTKRDIPCHLFQGIREDWPEPAAKVSSLWEWCFSVNMTKDEIIFKNGEFGLVSVQIVILKSGIEGAFATNLKIIHHFYDINRVDPALMDATNFDISRCYRENEKRYLQFVVDWLVTGDNYELVENSTSDLTFLQKWKSTIYQFSGLQSFTLRVSKVRSMVIDERLYVKFTLLSPHSQLPDELKKSQKGSFDAENELRKNINAGNVFIYKALGKDLKLQKLYVKKHSLEFQVNKTFEKHTLPPSTPEPSTTPKPRFSLITEPERKSTSAASTSAASTSAASTSAASTSAASTSAASTSAASTSASSTSAASTSAASFFDGSTSDRGASTDSTITETEGTSTSPPLVSSPSPLKGQEVSGHQAGAVAAVSISMLLIGISIGSAGTFLKFNGLPDCMRGNTGA